MTRKNLILIAAGGSLALLLGAWGFQALGYAPCKMCIWQRWPHGAAILIGAAALVIPLALLALLGAAAAATTGAIGIYHTGVEKGWWTGPTTCTSGDISEMSSEDLFDSIMAAPLVRCDEIPWDMFGLSMAGWNAAISAVLVLLWLAAWRAKA